MTVSCYVNQVVSVRLWHWRRLSRDYAIRDCAINDGLLQPLPHMNQSLLQVSYVTDLRLLI